MHAERFIDIRLLGPLRVLRTDGSAVAVHEWRTGKNMDLLRLLALNNGRPVRPEALVQRLWPEATSERGRASLRTACSQLRGALRSHAIVRQPDGLLLDGARVDAVHFQDQAKRVAVAARELRHVEVVEIARTADQIYADDFHAYDDDSDWAIDEREHLAHVHLELLRDAAVSAEALHLYREAAELATRAIRLDRASETAHRVLMSAHAELGDIASALRVFESYRLHLADELGADPSPQTQELHLRLLRGDSA